MRIARSVAVIAALTLVGCGSTLSRSAREQMSSGAAAAQRGYWQEALFRFERAHAAAPNDAEVLNNMAVAQEALGHYEEALQTYKQALQHAPHDTTIRRNYARFAEFYTSYARGVQPKRDHDARP
jgi:Flp pilus assembly protein TadD